MNLFKMILIIFAVGWSISLFKSADAYVLVQLRRNDNSTSKVNAVIQKVIPSARVDKFSARMARSSLDERILREEEKFHSDNNRRYREKERTSVEFLDLLRMAAKKVRLNKLGPVFRSKTQDYLLKPETVNLRTGKKSVYTINQDNIVDVLKDILSSTALQRYVNQLSKQAAPVTYKTVKQEIWNRGREVSLNPLGLLQ